MAGGTAEGVDLGRESGEELDTAQLGSSQQKEDINKKNLQYY
jgi:hypothetical protein